MGILTGLTAWTKGKRRSAMKRQRRMVQKGGSSRGFRSNCMLGLKKLGGNESPVADLRFVEWGG